MDKNANENDTSKWVDDRMADLALPADWEPSTDRAFEAVRTGACKAKYERRTWVWAAVGVSVVGLVMLALPSTRALTQIAWEDPSLAPAAAVQAGPTDRAEQPQPVFVAVFGGEDSLVRPEGYRDWPYVGTSDGRNHPGNPDVDREGSRDAALYRNVYIDPSAYQEYARTGEFPEGTVMVSELVSSAAAESKYEATSVGLEASVKDSGRFERGWGFFRFTDSEGNLTARALVSPEEACWSCHNKRAETDHVFTQSYPVLRSVGSE